MKTQWHNYWSI